MRYIYITICLMIGMSAFGQSKKAFIEAAAKAELEQNHYAALSYYNEALLFDKDDPEVLWKSAEAARNWRAYEDAETKYSKLIDTLNATEYPDARYYLGEVRMLQGQYDEAKMDFELYLSENEGDDEMLTAKAKKELAAMDWIKKMKEQQDLGFKIELVSGDVNSEYSDFGAIKVDEDLYYSSLRYEPEDPKHKPARLISKIIKSNDSDGSLPLDGEINMTDMPVAHTAFNADRSRMYYTICEYVNASELRCDIYFREMNPDGTMGSQMNTGMMVNDSAHTSTQPNIALMDDGQEIMYFVSDRDGSKGGLDIWSAPINDDGTLGAPTNIEEINTSRNDITPFYHVPSGMLYFSSRGYMSIGGYDIYVSQLTPDGYSTPENMGMPANSSYDEVYFTLNDTEDEAHFSSNREGSQNISSNPDACCFDIYRADIEEVDLILNGLTFDYISQRPLSGVTVQVLDARTGEEVGNVTNDEGNEHFIPLRKNREYIIIGTKDEFYPDTIDLSTKGMTTSDTIVRKLYLDTDMYVLEVTTYDTKTREELSGAIVSVIDVTGDEPDLVETNKIGNEFYFIIKPDREYKIVAKKEGYVEASTFISTKAGVNDDKFIKRKMYLLKPELDSYLPLALYFDNDRPDNNSRKSTTDKIYSDLYNDYMERKGEFIEEYSSVQTSDSDGDPGQAIEAFFSGKVETGYTQLKIMMEVLVKELNLGQKVDISIRGYASPRFETKYNLVLGQRRVASVKNEMLNYQGGILRQYIISGQLNIIDVSFGEELAPSDVEDSINQDKLSVYSPEASLERRVEIISVTKNKF